MTKSKKIAIGKSVRVTRGPMFGICGSYRGMVDGKARVTFNGAPDLFIEFDALDPGLPVPKEFEQLFGIAPEPIFKKCPCGKSFTREEWRALPFVGVAPYVYPADDSHPRDEREIQELRNCSCGSTLLASLGTSGEIFDLVLAGLNRTLDLERALRDVQRRCSELVEEKRALDAARIEEAIQKAAAGRALIGKFISVGGWTIAKTACHCNREEDGHGWAVLFEGRMVGCLGCLRDK